MKASNMTRKQLYELVWSKPMTHIAKEFGMSDVAVRKHCVKHDIPTPSVGYWAKVAHGKSVERPLLPVAEHPADAPVLLTKVEVEPTTPEAERAAIAAEAKIAQLRTVLQVAEDLPKKPHAVVKAIRAGLRRTKADEMGFVRLEATGLPEMTVGRASVDRALRILQAIFTVADEQDHELVRADRRLYWVVDGERFVLRLYEIQGKRPHEPTAKELKKQAQEDAWRARYRSDRETNRKVYRTWDYFPSGRLTIALQDTNSYSWRERGLSKRWRDRKGKTLEDQLAEIFAWLEPASVMAREKRLEIEDRRRREAEEAERRRLARERRESAGKLEKYLIELSDAHTTIRRLEELLSFWEGSAESEPVVARITEETRAYRETLMLRLAHEDIARRLDELEISLGEELLIPALAEAPVDPLNSWLR